ncbi:MAG: hypothetical protein ABJF10_09160 [Chthoniobacter sp.]|uniref:hypothetical protein n=1 Tax=Chthoniobacter sp. TaxID=2510640 RepID=UPI0032ABD22A
MSTEPDYNFNPPAASGSNGISILLPFALLSAAIAVVMVAQTVNVFKARTSLRDGKTQLTDAYQKRQTLVKQSADIQQKLQALVLDLLLLAKTDDDAKAIVGKYNIQQNAPEGSSAPAPEPAK